MGITIAIYTNWLKVLLLKSKKGQGIGKQCVLKVIDFILSSRVEAVLL